MKSITPLVIVSGAVTFCAAQPLEPRLIAPWSRKTYKIEDLTIRKQPWQNEQISFAIANTNGDPQRNQCNAWNFQEGVDYPCGQNSAFTFNYNNGVLTLVEKDTEHKTSLKGQTNVGYLPCRSVHRGTWRGPGAGVGAAAPGDSAPGDSAPEDSGASDDDAADVDDTDDSAPATGSSDENAPAAGAPGSFGHGGFRHGGYGRKNFVCQLPDGATPIYIELVEQV